MSGYMCDNVCTCVCMHTGAGVEAESAATLRTGERVSGSVEMSSPSPEFPVSRLRA